MLRFDEVVSVQLSEVLLLLSFSSAATYIASEAGRTTLPPHDVPQIIVQKLLH